MIRPPIVAALRRPEPNAPDGIAQCIAVGRHGPAVFTNAAAADASLVMR